VPCGSVPNKRIAMWGLPNTSPKMITRVRSPLSQKPTSHGNPKPSDHKFGALLDSSLDRYSDALYYGGFIYYFLQMGDLGFAVLGFSACVASFEVSYVRARSEGLGFPCDVGFWERGERTLVIILGLVFGNPHMAILLLGTLPHGTAVRRIFHSRRRMMMAARKEAANETPKKDRRSPISLALAALIFLAILFLRI